MLGIPNTSHTQVDPHEAGFCHGLAIRIAQMGSALHVSSPAAVSNLDLPDFMLSSPRMNIQRLPPRANTQPKKSRKSKATVFQALRQSFF